MKREKHFMIDIESTGVDFVKDDVLEIGVVEIDFSGGYWVPGRVFHTFLHSIRKPESQFAKERMEAVYRSANASTVTTEQARHWLLSWLKQCGKVGHDVLFVGWNAANFDVSMLNAKGILKRPGYETIDGKDIQVGDHHYRVYEMCGAIQLACDVLLKPYEDFKEHIKTAYDMPLPEGKEHDAIYDCYMQIKMLNGLIKVMREAQ